MNRTGKQSTAVSIDWDGQNWNDDSHSEQHTMNRRQAVKENRIWKLVDKLQNTRWVHPGQITDWIWFFVGIPHQHFHLPLWPMRGKCDTAHRGLGTVEPPYQELNKFTEETKLWYCDNCRLVAICILFYHCLHACLLTKRQIALVVCKQRLMSVLLLCFQRKLLLFDPH